MKITIEQISKEKVMLPFKVEIIFETEAEVRNEIKVIDRVREASEYEYMGMDIDSFIMNHINFNLITELRRQGFIVNPKPEPTPKPMKSK